jgi:hypothetical protein
VVDQEIGGEKFNDNVRDAKQAAHERAAIDWFTR